MHPLTWDCSNVMLTIYWPFRLLYSLMSATGGLRTTLRSTDNTDLRDFWLWHWSPHSPISSHQSWIEQYSSHEVLLNKELHLYLCNFLFVFNLLVLDSKSFILYLDITFTKMIKQKCIGKQFLIFQIWLSCSLRVPIITWSLRFSS